jgi:hypothetical protein
MATITIAAVVGASAAVAGAGVSVYGAQSSAAAQRSAAASNAALAKQQAAASAAVARYQAKLNYATAMANADVNDKNAVNLRQQARVTELQGAEAINRLTEGQAAQNSANRAAVGASGVTVDSGSPLVVEAYNAGNQQLQRMDALYQTNMAASEKDWAGTMQSYQAAVTRETAKQYQYAEAMADWSEKMGIASAGVQQQAANNAADATLYAGYGNALSQLGSAASNFGYASMQYSSMRNGANSIIPSQSTSPSLIGQAWNTLTAPIRGLR